MALQEQSAGGKPHHIRRSRRYWRLKRDSINAEFTEIISFWTISQTVLYDIFACIVCTHVCRHSLSKHMQRNSTDGSMSFTEYYWSCWFIIWRSPVTPDRSPLHHCHLKVCPPDERFTVIWSHLRSVQSYSCFNCLFIKRLQVQGNLWDKVPHQAIKHSKITRNTHITSYN